MQEESGRRHQLAEEVPGLYIRRLTLEDPRSARESSSSRSQSPTRHICHPTTGYVPSTRRSSSYRSWLERIRKERPPFLTIVSLELPESPIPLIESQANGRTRPEERSESIETKDEDPSELLKKVTLRGGQKEKESCGGRKRSSKKSRGGRKRGEEFVECTKGVPTLEECTRNIVEGSSLDRLKDFDLQDAVECICSEIPENFRVSRGKERGETQESRSPSPAMTHIIRIAMKYHDRSSSTAKDEVETEGRRISRSEAAGREDQTRKELLAEDDRCVGVNDALDFTLNCSSLRLTSRDTNPRTGAGAEKQQGPETRD